MWTVLSALYFVGLGRNDLGDPHDLLLQLLLERLLLQNGGEFRNHADFGSVTLLEVNVFYLSSSIIHLSDWSNILSEID